MSAPLVSVVIPTYDRPVFLKRCLESIIGQSYDNIEIIVVDDNNPETEARLETEKVMAAYKDNSKIKYIQHEKNKNGSAARNTGWRNSSGEYITFVDDDDKIAETKLEKQVKCLEKLDDSWGMCYTKYRLIKEHGDNQISSEKREGDCYVDALMRTMFMGSGSNLFLRKSVVDEIGGYDETFQRNQDIEFLARSCEKYKIAYIDEVLLTIYQEGNRVERTFDQIDGYTKHYIKKFKSRINKLNSNDKGRVKAVISLERFRVALMKKEFKKGVKILKDNHVGIKYILRYFRYLVKRKITHESYGFNGK
ncbi:MAG: glycosyltransferase family 2 protein [Lachnospiraceae bacterium]|nr:glycosyltransferase family 2 protein [Lachnospiraceae bacterium]